MTRPYGVGSGNLFSFMDVRKNGSILEKLSRQFRIKETDLFIRFPPPRE